MNLQSVTNHSSYQRALAWVNHRQGSAPSGWLPAGLERLDDTWFADHPTLDTPTVPVAAFEGLPPALATRARAACGVDPALRIRLAPNLCEVCARWCWSHLVDLPEAADHEPSLLDEAQTTGHDGSLAATLPRLSPHTVVRAVSLAGLADLGGLLAHAPDRSAATICGRLPPAWRRRVWQARTTNASPGHTALFDLTGLTQSGDPTEVLFSLGAGRFASIMTPHPLWLLQTAQLLPVPVARHLIGAVAPTDSVPDIAPLVSALREATAPRDLQ